MLVLFLSPVAAQSAFLYEKSGGYESSGGYEKSDGYETSIEGYQKSEEGYAPFEVDDIELTRRQSELFDEQISQIRQKKGRWTSRRLEEYNRPGNQRYLRDFTRDTGDVDDLHKDRTSFE